MQPSPTTSSMPSSAARSRGSLLRISASDLLSKTLIHFRVLETIPFPKVNVIRLNRFMEELAGL